MYHTIVALWLILTSSDGTWQSIHADDTLRIWARAHVESDIHEVKATRVMPVAIDDVWATITDVEHFVEFMPYVAEARVVKRTDSGHFEYLRINPPFVSQRDYTLHVTVEQDEGFYQRSWTIANAHGPAPTDNAVRLQICDGSWTLRRVDADHTEVTYWIYTDPAGSIPAWVANRANHQSIPEVLDAVHQRAQKLRIKS